MKPFQFLLACLLTVAAAARSQAGVTLSQTRYVYDRFGHSAGAVVLIQTDLSNWTFTLSARFLNLPVDKQVALLDNQFNLGKDRDAVAGVLQSMQQAQQQAAMQQNIDNINRQIQQQMDDLNRQQQQQQMMDNINRQIQQATQPHFTPPPMPFIPPPPVVPFRP